MFAVLFYTVVVFIDKDIKWLSNNVFELRRSNAYSGKLSKSCKSSKFY